jgi:Amt family ammonium transporter
MALSALGRSARRRRSPDLAAGGGRLSLSEKISRLRMRMHDAEWRRYAKTVFAGKMLGFGAILLVILLVNVVPALLSGTLHAQATTEPATQAAATQAATTAPAAAYPGLDATSIVNPVNTVWTLVAAFLVFAMQVGFTMLEAGFCRSRETVNVLVECVFDTCLCGLLFYAWGYAFMFGQGNGLIGWHDPTDTGDVVKSWFFLHNITAFTTYSTTGVPVLAHWVFQFAFADCASTICSGTMIGRTAFWGDILYSVCVSGFIYPIIGHWAWGPDGFLATMGVNPVGMTNPVNTNAYTHFLPSLGMNFHDFAGSTVVHSIGGWIALAGGIMLGPRIGRKFKRDGGGPMLPHDLTVAVCGGLLLWFGWYGFNPGSSLSAMDFGGIGRIAANTTLAACTGGLGAVFFMYFRVKKWDAGAITNGFLAGLVAITCPCYWVSPWGACWLGLIAGIIVILGVDLLEYLRIDDPIGAWPVHGLCGVWGTLSLGLFASGEYSAGGSSPTGIPVIDPNTNPALTGLFYHGGWTVLKAQAIGSFTICAATFVVAMVVFVILNAVKLLRISKEGEVEGMDLHEHGISAYPEYVISALAAPSGMGRDTVGYIPSSAIHSSGEEMLVGSKK